MFQHSISTIIFERKVFMNNEQKNVLTVIQETEILGDKNWKSFETSY